MPIAFFDKEGILIRICHGDARPENYKDNEFPKDFQWREISDQEAYQLQGLPESFTGPFPDPPEMAIRKLKEEHEHFKGVLEDLLKIPSGTIDQKISERKNATRNDEQ